MIPNRDLRSWSPKVQMSTLSMIIVPSEGSTILNNAWISVDFPLPVLPTTPIFSPPCMLIVMPFNTRGVLCLYLNCRSTKTNSCYFMLSVVNAQFFYHCTILNKLKNILYQTISWESTLRSMTSMSPFVGQLESGRQSLILHAASEGIFVNCLILSTETILFSMKQLIQMAQNNTWLRDRPYDSDRPTYSAP